MLKRFLEITMNDVAICGWKWASLWEMMNAQLPIPNGFVLTTKAYWKKWKEWENEVLEAFDKLNTKFVAVCSSGTKEDWVDDSFAWQFDTYLFVTRENLIEKIKECRDSVNSERIVSYCEYKWIDIKSIKVAVVVQKMVNSESAWVCFTVNPVSQNYDEIMIDAWFWIWEAVVSWMITPDNYIVNKKTWEIKKNISQQEKKLVLSDKWWTKEVKIAKEEQETQKLSDKHIQELAELAKKIEKHYWKPMDTEWAIENWKLFILQARPITTLWTKNENLVCKFLSSITKTENLLTPITSSSIFVQTCLELYPRYLPDYIDDNSSMNWLTLHHKGKTYTYVDWTKLINITNTVIQLFFNKKLTENNILKDFNRHTNQINNNYKLYNYDYLDNLSNKELIELAKKTINSFMEFDSISLFSIMINEDFLQNHFSTISKNNWLPKNFYEFAANIPILSFDKRQIEDIVSCIKDWWLNKKNLEKLQYLWTSYSKYTTLEDMKDFLLNNYGITTDFAKNETIKLKKEKERVKRLKNEYNTWYLTLTSQQQLLASFIRMSIEFRDKRKNYTLKAICTISRIMEIFFDKNWLDKKYLWNIWFGEILSWPEYILGLKDKLALREEWSVFFSDYNQQKLLVQEGHEAFADAFEKVQSLYNTDTQGNTIQWISWSSWKAKWVVKVIQFLDKDSQFQDWDILVTWMTRPEFVPLMKKASAIITDEWWITCHAAIVSRELWIPCVIWTKISTQVLKDWDFVEVDADNWIVTILKKECDISNLWNSSDYIRMFQTLYLPFINVYILNSYYKKLWVLSIYWNDTRTCYIPKDSMTETLKEWKIIYTDNKKYNIFIKDFETYKNSTISKYENIMNEKNLNTEKIKEFLYSLPTFFEFYSKTEFFYTDSLFSPQQTEEEREKFLKIVENVKDPWREFFNKLLFWEQSMLSQVLSKISEQTWIEKEILFLSTPKEIVSYISSSTPDKKLLDSRKKWYVLKWNWDNIRLFYDDTASEYLKTFYNKSKNEKILKWIIANTGRAIWKVRIFKYNYKTFDSLNKIIESMDKWDILVAETTSPELILACKKAWAIITNQWWMMSHAAIVSRELNIPCVIWISNATDILFDWMMVEVDANVGEVKIL